MTDSEAVPPSSLIQNDSNVEGGAAFFKSWHSLLSDIETPRGTCVELCAAAIAYLIGDDSRLPAPSIYTHLLYGDARHALLSANDVELFSAALPTVEKALREALESLGSDGALPRACGKAPADAGWTCPGGDAASPLRASAVSDVWTLLKASDRVRDAIMRARDRRQAPWIDLRAWSRIDAGAELRVFLCASDGTITAISQRRLHETPAPQLDAALIRDGGKAIASRLKRLCDTRGLCALARAHGGLFVDVQMKFGVSALRALVVNVTRYADRTADSSLLFEWTEIDAIAAAATKPPPLRLTSGSGGLHFAPLAAHAFPDEVFDFARMRMGDEGGGASDAVVRAAACRKSTSGASGWAALVEGLEAEGLFSSTSGDNDSSDEDA